MKQPLDEVSFRALTGADVATVERLRAYWALLETWQRRINLVGRGSMTDPWRRHMLDSAQLVPLLPAGRPLVVDLGSGAGFPGLVLAIMSDAQVHLVESDSRKCAFLAEAARITDAKAIIHRRRIELLAPLSATVVTARGCAPLPKLLAYIKPLLAADGYALLLKGRTAEAELTESGKTWKMRAVPIPSRSDSSGVVLKVSDIALRHQR